MQATPFPSVRECHPRRSTVPHLFKLIRVNTSDQQRDWVLASVEQYELPLLRYAARMGLDLDLARDCVQHAFLQLCSQSPDSLQRGAGPWLYRVVRNRAIDQLRRTQREIPFAALHAEEEEPTNGSPHPALTQPLSRESDPGEHSADRELSSLLRGLVAELPAATRELVLLWAEGLSHREIATVTERNEGNIRVQLHRAFARLREHSLVRRWLREDHADEPHSLEARIALTR
jgi:RNA polymerase sigma factor (sigma-70 family)